MIHWNMLKLANHKDNLGSQKQHSIFVHYWLSFKSAILTHRYWPVHLGQQIIPDEIFNHIIHSAVSHSLLCIRPNYKAAGLVKRDHKPTAVSWPKAKPAFIGWWEWDVNQFISKLLSWTEKKLNLHFSTLHSLVIPFYYLPRFNSNSQKNSVVVSGACYLLPDTKSLFYICWGTTAVCSSASHVMDC